MRRAETQPNRDRDNDLGKHRCGAEELSGGHPIGKVRMSKKNRTSQGGDSRCRQS